MGGRENHGRGEGLLLNSVSVCNVDLSARVIYVGALAETLGKGRTVRSCGRCGHSSPVCVSWEGVSFALVVPSCCSYEGSRT